MSDEIKLQVGDNIINFGRVHKIFKIEKKKGPDGKERDYIFYKPCFEEVNGLVCSVPAEKIDTAVIRRPVSLETLNELCDTCKKKVRMSEYPDVTEMSTLLNTNDPKNLIRVIRILNTENKAKENGLSTSKKNVFEKAIKNFIQEIAFVKNIAIEAAEAEVAMVLG